MYKTRYMNTCLYHLYITHVYKHTYIKDVYKRKTYVTYVFKHMYVNTCI